MILTIKERMHQLPCANPADEPPTRLQTGAWRDYLPERTRPAWCQAVFECLEVAVAKFEGKGKEQWARADVNMLIKYASARRQNFTRAQGEVLEKWERQRKAHWATTALDHAAML